ncbi:MAG: hypothetical protein IKJ04_08125, partial [Clostridia bacterium]|nr:hypothetical protein [Clostridia bacterium]
KMVPVIGVIRAGAPIVTDETLLGREFADVEDIEDYFYLGGLPKEKAIADFKYSFSFLLEGLKRVN